MSWSNFALNGVRPVKNCSPKQRLERFQHLLIVQGGLKTL
jgi:hypothetical protein